MNRFGRLCSLSLGFNTKKTFEIAPTRVVSILWEGQNNNEQTLESGTYFCRILVKDKYNRITQKTLKRLKLIPLKFHDFFYIKQL